ncbi:GNAT family N-acetyltransferase [Mesorhizobium sp. CGMCC 1.15528]|uniref:GNAT family N-acetyltransferase n=1 Tax=Mesorhizobium zhangyense TaxID=1776730 RepID=A0A7C9VAJ9_9HYPH|nr:GNAT family N-acetyltransferase [Mesorhizobium zhangyense]NGN39728.1 GNAT family N-acetyltransferase [Mesorhizobium zhangyense]
MADETQSIPVTVTFLEMGAPPVYYPSLPMNKQIALLKARAVPLHFYRYLMDRVGRKWQWVNALRLDDEELSAGLHREDRDVRILYLDGVPAGFFDIKPHLPGEAELAYFGMMEHAMGQGLGRWFLGAAIEAAWSHKPERVTVQTCTMDHPAALPLYQKLGFSPVGQKQEMVRTMSFAERSASVMRP